MVPSYRGVPLYPAATAAMEMDTYGHLFRNSSRTGSHGNVFIVLLGWYDSDGNCVRPLMPIGLVGLALSLFHGDPAYSLAIRTGLIESGKIVEGVGHVYVALVAGGIWGLIYGLTGCAIDFAMIHRKLKTNLSDGHHLQPPAALIWVDSRSRDS